MAAPPALPPPAEKGYFDALEGQRLIEKGAGSASDLAEQVRQADQLLVAGDNILAATRLYAIVEGPRYADLGDGDDYQNAEYLLGVALAKGGATAAARRYLERIAARKGATYAEPALRKLIDLALDAHDARGAVGKLDLAGVNPEDAVLKQELAYLRGRAAYEERQLDIADDEFKHVGPNCRFYSSAIYLRGVIAIHKSDTQGAIDAFCVVADTKPDDPLRFVVDGRYFTVRDLARLALGRVAHEQGRYDDALYHYFTITDDSNELARSLYESGWSMLQAKKYDLAGRLVDELMRQFPKAPIAVEGELLRATLRVKTCRFKQADKMFADFIAAYEPVAEAVAAARNDPAARLALAKRVLANKDDAVTLSDTVEGRLIRLLSVDPGFFRIREFARGLRNEADDAASVEAQWRALEDRLSGAKIQAVTAAKAPDDAITLLERTAELGTAVAAAHDEAVLVRDSVDPRGAIHGHALEELDVVATLEGRRAKLAARLKAMAQKNAPPPSLAGDANTVIAMAARDRANAASLRARAAALSEKLDKAEGELLGAALGDLDKRLGEMLRQARLGKIDSLIGQKKRLEKEIEDLAGGRFPASMANRLHIEGLIGDDEEYWPFDGERWDDEYEGYK
jgi:hypothetical protein